jgi:adenylate cyclase
MGSLENSGGDVKLESWKEIAAFFERDLRTVIRWEKELGLPVHRYPGKAKGRVYAHVSELKAWADGPRQAAAATDGRSVLEVAESDGNEDLLSPDDRGSGPDSPIAGPAAQGKMARLAALLGLAAALTVAGFGYLRYSRSEPITSVAVLPFDNLGGQSDPAFVEGLTDEIASSLSRLEGVSVAGRSSAYSFQGKRDNLRQVGSALNVEAVVEGSVQRSGDRTHVTVQVNRTRDGFIWSQTFDTNSRDLIPTETEIAAAVARTLSHSASASVAAPATNDPEARALYLQGRYLWNQRNFDAESKSVEYMRQAIAKDPNYAQAWSGLADSLMTIANLENVQASGYIAEARQAAHKALELDPNLADAHAVLGRIAAHYDYDWATAEGEYKKALGLNPSYVTAHQYYALGLMAHSRFSEAQQQLDIARQIDPLALIVGVDVALLRKFQRDYDGVIHESQRVLQLDPNYKLGYSMLATGYYLKKQWDKWHAIDANYPQNPVSRAVADGDIALARKLLAEAVQQAERGEIPPSLLVGQAIRVSDYELALNWLERSYQNHDYWLLFYNVDPENDPIRSAPRFQAMMKKLGVG